MRPSSARVAALGYTGWGMTRASTPSSASASRAALGVHDDPVEALEQPLPEIAARRGAPRQQVVRGEDGRRAEAEVHVGLRQRKPLHVHDVGPRARERRAARRACSAAFSGSRSRERLNSRDESG